MTLLKRATDSKFGDTVWLPVPEGLFRWVIGQPTLKFNEKWGKYQITFPLTLTPDEITRVTAEHGEPKEGEMQSYRVPGGYSIGLSLGYFKDGAYVTTKLVDFLCFSMGTKNAKDLRKFFEQGGGPPRPDDLDDQQAEIEAIVEWLKWFEGLEVYGSIQHKDDAVDKTKKWARFGGPMPVGSLPGQKDDDYQAFGRGKLRAIMADSGETRESHALEAKTAAREADKPAVQFTQKGEQVTTEDEAEEEAHELPF